MKSKVGIKKEIDSLGRMVIPKELRELYGFDGQVELVATEAGVLVRNPEYVLVSKEHLDDDYNKKSSHPC